MSKIKHHHRNLPPTTGSGNYAYVTSLDAYDLEAKLKEAKEELGKLRESLEQYRKTFEHYHVNNPEVTDDACRQCGLDLRNEIHTGVVRT